MVRTQIQITPDQARALKLMAAREGISVAQLIRQSVDAMLRSGTIPDRKVLSAKIMAAAGRFSGPADLSAEHDTYLAGAFEE